MVTNGNKTEMLILNISQSFVFAYDNSKDDRPITNIFLLRVIFNGNKKVQKYYFCYLHKMPILAMFCIF